MRVKGRAAAARAPLKRDNSRSSSKARKEEEEEEERSNRRAQEIETAGAAGGIRMRGNCRRPPR